MRIEHVARRRLARRRRPAACRHRPGRSRVRPRATVARACMRDQRAACSRRVATFSPLASWASFVRAILGRQLGGLLMRQQLLDGRRNASSSGCSAAGLCSTHVRGNQHVGRHLDGLGIAPVLDRILGEQRRHQLGIGQRAGTAAALAQPVALSESCSLYFSAAGFRLSGCSLYTVFVEAVGEPSAGRLARDSAALIRPARSGHLDDVEAEVGTHRLPRPVRP